MRYLLDTDTCIGLLRSREPVSSQVRRRSPEELAISAMTLAELRFGALRSSDPTASLAAIDAFLSAPIGVVPFDAEAGREHAAVRQELRAEPIGERDLVIAATALCRGLTVVTHNQRHFARVPNLSVTDWA